MSLGDVATWVVICGGFASVVIGSLAGLVVVVFVVRWLTWLIGR